MRLRELFAPGCTLLVASLLVPNASGQDPNPRLAITESPRNASASQPESVKSDRRAEPIIVETVPLPRFAVQVGTYRTRGNAEALAQELRSRYQFETLVTPLYFATQDQVYGATRTLHRVRVPVGTKAEAEALAARLTREVKLTTWVLPLTRRELYFARAAHKPHPVDIGQTEPSGSSDGAENTAASVSDTETNEATAGVLRVDEELAVTSSDNCYAYELDEVGNRITFNDPSIYVIMPPKSKRDRLRSRGTPAQIFWMKNCDTIDPIRQLEVYSQPNNAIEPDGKIPSTVRVVVLAQKGNWIQVRAALSNLWNGEGWIRLDDDLVVVKY